jgi:VRR-NUC domain
MTPNPAALCRYFKRMGYRATLLENSPIHVLFATYMWPVVQDPSDRQSNVVGFADREAYDAGTKSNLIWTRLPADFGKPQYATRRAKHIDRHMAGLAAQRQDLRRLFDQWLGPSRDLRNYLWAHRLEHIEVARELIDVLPADSLLEILRYLVENYWGRRAGWPDLLVHRQKEFILVEVKSARDSLGAAQQGWIRDNYKRLRLPFTVVKIHASACS